MVAVLTLVVPRSRSLIVPHSRLAAVTAIAAVTTIAAVAAVVATAVAAATTIASTAAVVYCYVFFTSSPYFDTLVIGGVAHDPINARRRLEQARAASAIAVIRFHRIHHRRRHRCRSLLSSPLPPPTPPLLSLPRAVAL